MGGLLNISTPTETLLGSDMLGAFIMYSFLLIAFLFSAFLNVYIVDQYEFQNNAHIQFFEFKRKMFFIFSYSKHKTIISKKTFVMEVIGYLLAIEMCIVFIVSLWQSVDMAFCLLIIPAATIIPFAVVGGIMHNKIEKQNRRRK